MDEKPRRRWFRFVGWAIVVLAAYLLVMKGASVLLKAVAPGRVHEAHR
jgi:hypothetical protein